MENSETLKSVGSFVTIISVVIGVVISVMNYRAAQEKEAESRRIEVTKPFYELRQKLYLEALNSASILASKSLHTEEEIAKAKKRFSELYWGELSLVEEYKIEEKMIAVAREEGLTDSVTSTQALTYELAHLMQKSIFQTWGVDTSKISK